MRLFNDNFYKWETSFICSGKEWGVGRNERERERKCEMRSAGGKGYCMGHKLDHWSSIYEGLETG